MWVDAVDSAFKQLTFDPLTFQFFGKERDLTEK